LDGSGNLGELGMSTTIKDLSDEDYELLNDLLDLVDLTPHQYEVISRAIESILNKVDER
jgi:hypothetical protein